MRIWIHWGYLEISLFNISSVKWKVLKSNQEILDVQTKLLSPLLSQFTVKKKSNEIIRDCLRKKLV